MHKKAEELMFANLLNFGENGNITLFNYPAFLFPSEFILKMEERLSPDEIYVLAKHIPAPIEKVLEERQMKDLERLDFLLELVEILGMGSLNIENFDKTSNTHKVIISNTNPNKISCNHTRGYLASAFSTSLEKNFECEETECVSTGSQKCVFILNAK